MDDICGAVIGVGENNELYSEGTDVCLKARVEFATADKLGSMKEWENCPSLVSPHKDVKSTAVVKYSTVPSLANFAVLQCNTDLNLPPSNWLSSSADSYGLQHVPSHSTGFSSFRMAHMFPECIGEVDVVSDAENIKKLLKIPYSKGSVSMMVHRIENTLLIDEFDIQKYLLRTTESEWGWLRKFFFDHVLQSLDEKERALPHKIKSRCALQQKSLVSKFLYHSLAVEQSQNEHATKTENLPERVNSSTQTERNNWITDSETPKTEAAVPVPVPKPDPPLPEPDLEEELPDPASKSKFTRTVVWTFEDIQMLIGTNLPIFGGKNHPCVSLRLRDMSKPINVLTGIDYWLDNLMCNVPELVMCYHLDGFVQKYELIKTEDLPHLENSKFSPKVIRDVAQNILSFLKSKATKAGHTYWLFKEKKAEVVKLYDLTSLCSDMMDDKGQNPFTVPVGMLLYRVARNMKHSNDGHRQRGTIRLLLQNSIGLLSKEKYPQIVTSAHYMLADLYIPADTDPAAPDLKETLEDDCMSSEFEEDIEGEHDSDENELCSSSVHVKSLCVSTSPSRSAIAPPPPLCTDVEERCNSALEHVAAGLNCLSFFNCDNQEEARCEKNAENNETEEPKSPSMAKPFEAIPMPYTPLKAGPNKERAGSPGSFKKKKKSERIQQLRSPRSLLCKYHTETMPTWQQPKLSDKVFWRAHLKILLYEKACLVYATMAENRYAKTSYGNALQYIGMVLKCQLQLQGWPNSTQNFGLESYLLGRAGDLCFMIVQDWVHVEKHRKEYNSFTKVDRKVLREIEAGNHMNKSRNSLLEFLPRMLTSIEDMLIASRECYTKALSLEPVEQIRSNLQRRLGNIENEIGVLFMNQASDCYQETSGTISSSENRTLQTLLTKSLEHLESGKKAFETVRDDANVALLHSNTGRLMRMWGHYQCPDPKQHNQMIGPEKHFYNKALVSYQKALQVLGARKNHPPIWDTVMWELSSALFSMATTAQDNPIPQLGKTPEEQQRELIELFLKALKYCDCETSGAHQPVYQFRAALIHHRLGALYHNAFRLLSCDDSKRKNLMQLSRLNYDKSCKMFMDLEYPKDYFRVLMERVALAETVSFSGTPHGRVKCLLNTLLVITQTMPMLQYLADNIAPEGCCEHGGEPKQPEQTRRRMKGSCEKYRKNSKVKTVEEKKKAICLHTEEDCKKEFEELDELLRLLEQRIQFILLHLVKLHHSLVDKSKDSEGNEILYKNLYSLTLRTSKNLSLKELSRHLLHILEQVDSDVCQPSPALKTR